VRFIGKMKNMNSSFAEYAADSRNPRRIALGGGDRGIKTVLGRIVERLRFASRRNGCFGGNFRAKIFAGFDRVIYL
uniref:hypothetical protein n=1 Tax=Alistipes putredinis TaxID=28117 RepID=UPI003FEF9312